jgi:signal transduction histidine kinase
MRTSGLSIPPMDTAGAATDEALLHLARTIVAAEDPHRCAHLVLDWLAGVHGLSPASCLVVDTSDHLVPLAGFPDEAFEGWVPIDVHGAHPLALALSSTKPVPVGREASGRRRMRPSDTPFGAGPFQAIPLCASPPSGLALGLLLVPPLRRRASHPDVLFATELLGSRLAVLQQRTFRRLRARLERERDLLQKVIDAVTDPLVLTDAHGRMRITNRRAEALFFSEEADSEGRRRAVALNNMLFSASRFTHGEGTSLKREVPLVDPSESRDLLFEVLSAPLSDADEDGSVAVLRDVTDLRRATEETEASLKHLKTAKADALAERDRLDLIIHSVVDPVLVTDPTGRALLLNPPAEQFVRDSGTLGDEAARRLQRNEAVLSSFLANLYATDAPRWTAELSLVALDSGAIVPFQATAGKVATGRGELTAVVTILHDMTEAIEKARLFEQVKRHSEELRCRVEEATAELANQNETLRRQAVALAQASAHKSQFLANMSHELRTPLHAIMGYANLLKEGSAASLDARQSRHLSRIESNAGHLLTIINALLDIARIESGKMPVLLETFTLPTLIDEVMGELSPLIERSGLDVHVDLERRLPKLHSDRQKVKQILVNLLSNALKFTPEGRISVTAGSAEGGRAVRIALEDTGIGISTEEQQVIFDDFQQADSSPTRAYGGTGLGLSISKRLAEMLGGRITVQSAPARGSTFTVLLPCRVRQS